MKTARYWERAALLREIAIQDGATYTAEEIIRLYSEALDDIEVEIKKIVANFQRRFGIDNETAEYFLTQAQEDANTARLLKALEQAPTQKARDDILEYIRRDGLSARAYTARRERYRAVEKEIYARIKAVAADAIPMIEGSLKNAYMESYYGMIDDIAEGLNAGINFSILNDRAINAAVSAKWHGERFSERIWKHTDKLAEEAQTLVVKALMSGEAGNKTAAKLAERFEVNKFRAVTLVRTETAHIHQEADFKAYEDLEIKKYKYLAKLDYATCELCQPLDGRTFNVSDRAEGVNAPVMHPRCRCTTTFDMNYVQRRARDPLTGRNSIIDGNVTYSQWKESLTEEQKSALELAKKKNSNRTRDKLQHTQYQKVLGRKVVPQSFDKFQDLKYNNTERWEEVKSLFKGLNNGTVVRNFNGQNIKIVPHTTLKSTPNSITQYENKKGGIDRNYYDENGKQSKQISNNGHGHEKEEKLGKHGEHAHDYHWNGDEFTRSTSRELTDEERKENEDIL